MRRVRPRGASFGGELWLSFAPTPDLTWLAAQRSLQAEMFVQIIAR